MKPATRNIIIVLVIVAVITAIGWATSRNGANENTNTRTNVNTNTNANSNGNTNQQAELPTALSSQTTGSYVDGIKGKFSTGDRILITLADVAALQTTETAARFTIEGPHFAGQCFTAYSLSPNRKTTIFTVGCEPGDLALPWVGLYDVPSGKISFLDDKGGSKYRWTSDSTSVTYTVDLGLSGMQETHRATAKDDGTFVVTKVQ